ncbi:phage protein [Streptococcus pyogenes]|nr:phage protein [Streptococcus pyogenes]VGV16277.1 phage protein [Streptococcus pyogenes]VGV49483.1 phage protein [Streptococcus pyogenes]VHA65955.1 phage protein [Streptococcus pyogenes]VHA94465.1 phage protein [Streptococcus pyogenes]
MEQIKITETGMVVISDKALKTFVIAGHLSERWEFTSKFKKLDEPSLDENGDLFEPVYELMLEAACQDTTDNIKKPSHYQGRHGMEAIDVVKNFSACPEHEEGFYWGNAVKYLLRYHAKNGIEDLKKARQNLDWLIEKLEEVE